MTVESSSATNGWEPFGPQFPHLYPGGWRISPHQLSFLSLQAHSQAHSPKHLPAPACQTDHPLPAGPAHPGRDRWAAAAGSATLTQQLQMRVTTSWLGT